MEYSWYIFVTWLMVTVSSDRNITNNPGILPINLGKARLQSSSHHMIHYFDISGLLTEYNKLQTYLEIVKNSTANETETQKEIQNYLKIIHYNINLVDEKLYPFFQNKRAKRGLVNILGSIIKTITGNMDSEDNERITSVINTIKQNQNNIAHQLTNQYSINQEIINKFEKTIKDIEHNERALYSLTSKFQNVTRNQINTLFIKDTLNQLSHLFNVILNIAQDIENSLAFCKLQTVHPSIITNEELFKELLKIESIYKNHLPFPVKSENIQNYKRILSTKCVIKEFEIIYFLSFPLYETRELELFYLIPLPDQKFQTIIPSAKYVLKGESYLWPLTDICDKIQKEYFCKNELRTYVNISCQMEILFKNTFEKCLPIQLNRLQTLEFVPEINQYLGIFPVPVSIKNFLLQCFGTTPNPRCLSLRKSTKLPKIRQ
nr:PREDICTED: uncharacterized protein LOC107399075 [Tribolium castaneum]|eukprot:XP_015840241.1 PREDICTED: uncharacterized protein LOC107399075 [Tribolium castaneum]